MLEENAAAPSKFFQGRGWGRGFHASRTWNRAALTTRRLISPVDFVLSFSHTNVFTLGFLGGRRARCRWKFRKGSQKHRRSRCEKETDQEPHTVLKIPSVCHLFVVELHLPCCQLLKPVQKRNGGIALNNLRKAHVVGNVGCFFVWTPRNAPVSVEAAVLQALGSGSADGTLTLWEAQVVLHNWRRQALRTGHLGALQGLICSQMGVADQCLISVYFCWTHRVKFIDVKCNLDTTLVYFKPTFTSKWWCRKVHATCTHVCWVCGFHWKWMNRSIYGYWFNNLLIPETHLELKLMNLNKLLVLWGFKSTGCKL